MSDEPYQVTERGDPRDRVANQRDNTEAVRLLRRVVQADKDDATMGHPNPGDSCIAACIGLEVMPWLSALDAGEPT